MSPEHFFANYTKRKSALPKPVWQVLRVLTLLATLGFAILLTVDPAVGLAVYADVARVVARGDDARAGGLDHLLEVRVLRTQAVNMVLDGHRL